MFILLKHKTPENKIQFLQQIATSCKDENLIIFIQIVVDGAFPNHEKRLVASVLLHRAFWRQFITHQRTGC
jgi:hypothetical protein